MNYFITATQGVSKDQDFSDSTEMGLIICDGIGSLPDSAAASSAVVEQFIHSLLNNEHGFEDQLVIDEIAKKIKEIEGVGGTTLIFCRELDEKRVRIGYLGNGGGAALRGDFFEEKLGNQVHLYSNLLLPHVDRSGALTRHISSNSKEDNIQLSTIDLSLNSDSGDILIFFSDGLGSIETQFIADLNDEGIWRSETVVFQQLLKSLHNCISGKCDLLNRNKDSIVYELKQMLVDECARYKAQGLLEDDISIGILVTDKVFDYYQSKLAEHE